MSSIFQLEQPSKFKFSIAPRPDEGYCQYCTMHILKGKAALLVIDVQHDFIDDGAPVHCVGGKDMLPKIKQLIEACRGADIPVIYTQEVHRASHVDMGRELDGNEPDHCIIGSKGVEIMEEIAPDDK